MSGISKVLQLKYIWHSMPVLVDIAEDPSASRYETCPKPVYSI